MSLATIVRLDSVIKHPDADSLDLVRWKGWQCVAKLGEFKAGDLAVYIEIDTWVPHEVAPFLSKGKEPRNYEGILGERLRTVRLRGELSQGLVLPLSVLNYKWRYPGFCHDGTDVTEWLGVRKWHAPVPACLGGDVDPWPGLIPKTDQENVQNVYGLMRVFGAGVDWVVEEKLDGASCTVYCQALRDVAEGYYKLGVCSRNWELKQNENNSKNSYVDVVSRFGYLDHLHKFGRSVALQGELCGPGIQGNPYGLKSAQLFIFDLYYIDEKRYATWAERQSFLYRLGQMIGKEIPQVPLIEASMAFPGTLEQVLDLANGNSKLAPNVLREGLVFKTRDLVGGYIYSFKSVSNLFLEKQK